MIIVIRGRALSQVSPHRTVTNQQIEQQKRAEKQMAAAAEHHARVRLLARLFPLLFSLAAGLHPEKRPILAPDYFPHAPCVRRWRDWPPPTRPRRRRRRNRRRRQRRLRKRKLPTCRRRRLGHL